MYATIEDMLARSSVDELKILADPARGANDVMGERTAASLRTEEALRIATGKVESYLRKRYRLPLETPPAAVVEATCVLAMEWLADANPNTVPTESMVSRRKETVRWLEQLATGAVTLEGASAVTASPSAGARVSDREQSWGHGGRRIF